MKYAGHDFPEVNKVGGDAMTVFRLSFISLLLMSLFMPELAAQQDAWKDSANDRIHEIRQRDIQILVVDAGGNPVPGASVELRQVRKAFPFGSAVNPNLLSNERYQEFFKKHFNWAVFENASKWYSNERTPGQPDFSVADAMYEWCERNEIPVRGHCIFWEPERWQMPWVRALTPTELRAAVERRLRDVVLHFRGRFPHWDVNNEMLHGSFFKDRLGEEIHPWMFQAAHELDPEAKLFVNEFNILTVDQNYQEVEVDEYIAHIEWLQSQGAPIHGIGVQGHIWKDDILSTPTLVKERLDKLAGLGLPIWISEFDSAFEDERTNADVLELIFRTAYSHPSVEGIMLWVFWAGASWRGPNAGLARLDWTLNEAGERFISLMQEWTTSEDGESDREGRFAGRGFFGDYSVRVETPQGEAVETALTLSPGPGPHVETVVIPGSR
jgi:endo-1,4-beta-xylanase